MQRRAPSALDIGGPSPRPPHPDIASWTRSLDRLGAEGVVAVVVVMIASGLFQSLLWTTEQAWLIGDVIWPALYLTSGLLLVREAGLRWLWWGLARVPLLAAVPAVALLSTLWSVDPWWTFRSAVALTGTIMIGFWLGYRFPPRELMRILVCAFGAMLVVHLATIAAVPEYGVTGQDSGYLRSAWRGASGNKNILGAQAALAAALYLAGTATGRMNRYAGAALSALALLLLFCAQAVTAIIALGAALIVLGCLWLAKRARFPTLVTCLILLVVAAVLGPLLVLRLDLITEPLSREASFSGRIGAWSDALRAIRGSPWIGHGFGAIWGRGAETWFPHLASTRVLAHAHNGYLQLAAELGLPVLALGVVHLLRTGWLAVTQLAMQESGFALFAVTLTTVVAILNIAESWFFSQQQLVWIVLVAIGVALVRMSVPLRLMARARP